MCDDGPHVHGFDSVHYREGLGGPVTFGALRLSLAGMLI
jgi:hypothetical protein